MKIYRKRWHEPEGTASSGRINSQRKLQRLRQEKKKVWYHLRQPEPKTEAPKKGCFLEEVFSIMKYCI